MGNPQSTHIERGGFLSALIVLFAAAITLVTFVLVIDPPLAQSLGYLPPWFNPFLLIFLLARLAALAGIWSFRRWGAYALLLLEALEVGMGLFVFTGVLNPLLRALLALPASLVLLVVWIVALRPQWQAFR